MRTGLIKLLACWSLMTAVSGIWSRSDGGLCFYDNCSHQSGVSLLIITLPPLCLKVALTFLLECDQFESRCNGKKTEHLSKK